MDEFEIEPEAPRARYQVFISYSHTDMAFARRLHEWLNTYVYWNARVFERIFRDETAITAGSLPDTLAAALRDSAKLVVILSEEALASRWVVEELRTFAALDPPRPIFAILAPSAREPSQLQRQLQDLIGRELFVPDPRMHGEKRAFMGLFAGLIGLPLDQVEATHHSRLQKLRVEFEAQAKAAAGYSLSKFKSTGDARTTAKAWIDALVREVTTWALAGR